MRVLLAVHNVYTDHTSGAAKSARVLTEWMAADGNDCRVLATARFDGNPPGSFDDHLAGLGVPVQRRPAPKKLRQILKRSGHNESGRIVARYTLGGVPVETILTEHNDFRRPDKAEYLQFVFQFDNLVTTFRPDLVFCYGAHPVVREVMRRAKAAGIATLFRLPNYGYDAPNLFRYVDHVLFSGDYLRRHYAQKIGLSGTALPSPIDWSEVLAAEPKRVFLTFINPSLRKGAALFSRLADMLGRERPDIPILVVQSASDATLLNAVPGIDFSKYPQIVASPPTPRPADIFELARVLLVPSVFAEPTGRVAAEAMMNGIPPIVSDRGGLPETVDDAGIVLPLPGWMTPETVKLPSEDETRPWFDAVCALWDDEQTYSEASKRARETAERLYSEAVLKPTYLDYIRSLEPGGNPLGRETRAAIEGVAS